MKLEIRNFLGEKIQLEPRLGLYRVSDMMGKRLPGLAVFLDELTSAGPGAVLCVDGIVRGIHRHQKQRLYRYKQLRVCQTVTETRNCASNGAI